MRAERVRYLDDVPAHPSSADDERDVPLREARAPHCLVGRRDRVGSDGELALIDAPRFVVTGKTAHAGTTTCVAKPPSM